MITVAFINNIGGFEVRQFANVDAIGNYHAAIVDNNDYDNWVEGTPEKIGGPAKINLGNRQVQAKIEKKLRNLTPRPVPYRFKFSQGKWQHQGGR